MGQRNAELKPVNGLPTETGRAVTWFLATSLGAPVSASHTITGAVFGVGSIFNASAVRWGLAGQVVTAWIIIIPATVLIATGFYGPSCMLF